MCNPVEALFSRTIPEQVWHYTTVQAFEGIVTSGRMWATDVRFTNDKTEFIHARDIAKVCIDSLDATGGLSGFPASDLRNMLATAFDEGPLSPLRNQVYLVCFSQAGDLLTQWTQYAGGGHGVSIAFDLRYIRPPKEAEIAVTFAPCVYRLPEKEQLVSSTFARWTETVSAISKETRDTRWVREQLKASSKIDRICYFQTSWADLLRGRDEVIKVRLYDAWKKTRFDLLRVASHCKDEAFFAEQEWRLVLPRPATRQSSENPIKFRGTRGTVPYFESNLFHEGNLPISEIKVGPLCNETERVRQIVERNGYNCPVTTSSVPLRETGTI
jgi:hypothetical protein